MKIRAGFVSNSSSSSFMCDICRCTESGWDACLSDVEMVECGSCGITLCERHMLPLEGETLRAFLVENAEYIDDGDVEKVKDNIRNAPVEDLEGYYDEYKNDDHDWRYGIAAVECPHCMLHELLEEDMLAYLIKKMGYSDRDAVAKEIKDNFVTLKGLDAYEGITQPL